MFRHFASLCSLLLLVAPAIAAEPAPAKILLIGQAKDEHPRETHEYLPACELLAKCLRQTPGIQVAVSQGWPNDAAQLGRFDGLVLYLPWGSNALFDGPQRETAKQWLHLGTGLVAIHWATGAQRDEFGQLWLDQMGAWFNTDFSKLAHVEQSLHVVDPGLPICRRVQDFTMFDEYYFKLRFSPDVKPVLTTQFEGQTETIAWTYERPNSHQGRSFGCVAGHYHKNFGNESFRRLLVQATLWTIQRDVPPDGAPIQLERADLELPEKAASR